MPHESEWDRMPDRLDAWMQRMENKVDGLRTDISGLMAVRDRVEEHHARIYGNGQPGLIKDVDRVKQRARQLGWLVGLFCTVATSAVAAEVVKMVWGHSR